MTQQNGFVAVTENVAGAGSSVFWSLRGDQNRDALVAEWKAEGLDAWEVPQTRGDEAALWRAVDSVVKAANASRPADSTAPLLRSATVPMAKGDGKHVIALGWERWSDDTRTETRDGAWKAEGRVIRYTDGTRDHLELEGLATQYADAIRSAYARERGRLPHSSVSNWLANRVIPSLGGVNLKTAADGAKSAGGLYYLPPDSVDLWRRMVRALRAADAGRFYELPTMRSDEAVAAILDALTVEITDSCATMEDALVEDDMGVRALRSSAERAQTVLAKVGRYEKVLALSLDNLREQAERTIAAHTAAILASEALAAGSSDTADYRA